MNMCSVTQSCLTLCDPMDCSPPGSSGHGIFQARILKWVAISYSRGSSQPRGRTSIFCVSCIGRRILYCRATKEAQLLHYIFPSTKKEAQHPRAFGGLEAACATPRNGGHERLPGLSEAQSRQMPCGRSSQQYRYFCYLDHMIQQTQWCQRHQ